MNIVYFSIGTNKGNRINNIQKALQLIEEKIGVINLKSSIYENPPLGFEADMNFFNLCIELETKLSPEEVLEESQNIESIVGRTNKSSIEYASREIDLDIIFFNDLVISSNKLTIPHQHYKNRRFVLKPLSEIAGNFKDPLSKLSVEKLLSICSDNNILKAVEFNFN